MRQDDGGEILIKISNQQEEQREAGDKPTFGNKLRSQILSLIIKIYSTGSSYSTDEGRRK